MKEIARWRFSIKAEEADSKFITIPDTVLELDIFGFEILANHLTWLLNQFYHLTLPNIILIYERRGRGGMGKGELLMFYKFNTYSGNAKSMSICSQKTE